MNASRITFKPQRVGNGYVFNILHAGRVVATTATVRPSRNGCSLDIGAVIRALGVTA